MDDLSRTRELAEKATPGPWRVDEDEFDGPVVVVDAAPNPGCMPYRICSDVGGDLRGATAELPTVEANAAYIAHLSPERVLGMVEEIERLREAVKTAYLEGCKRGNVALVTALGSWNDSNARAVLAAHA